MFKGSVCPHRWIYKGKRRKARGIRWSMNGGPVKREIVADIKEGRAALVRYVWLLIGG